MVQESDKEARVLAETQYGKHRLESDDNFCFKISSFGGLERLVIAEEHENVSREATKAEVKIARFSRSVLLCEGITEHVDLPKNRREFGEAVKRLEELTRSCIKLCILRIDDRENIGLSTSRRGFASSYLMKHAEDWSRSNAPYTAASLSHLFFNL